MRRKTNRYRYVPFQTKKRRQRLKPVPIVICIAILILAVWGCQSLFSDSADSKKDTNTSSDTIDTGKNQTNLKTESSDKIDKSAWYLVLANQSHKLDEDFVPETKEIPNGQQVDERIYDSLMKMVNDAKEEGLNLVVCSGYRPYDLQVELFEDQIQMEMENGYSREEAEKRAATTVAIPGTSEHQTGLAVDIVALDYQNLDEGVMDTPEVKWLYEHCQEYGFIVRYPDGKSDITKIIYEPWHYRYVGKEAATEIMSKGITLEEYLGEIA
ncbi:MAG: M15 family metallopeptidase [Massiliimalia sp.]|jgi:D-alanyl-D-alanine carboxypeptidase